MPAAEAPRAPSPPRSFLFLQGPISNFFDRLGRALIARGHHVHRINLHFGDRLFWRLPAANYRGRLEDFRAFVAAEIERHQVTHLILHGDRRPYHLVAAEEARARGIPVIATDLGYVRPDWITLEHDGLTTYSRFPHDPAAIRALASGFPDPDLRRLFHTPFWLIAVLDVVYNLALVFGGPLYPHYRYHSIVHPFAEYGGWLWSRTRERFTAGTAAAVRQRLMMAPRSYFLVPLQLATDYQIRAHSPYRDLREAVHEIVASFAASGSRRELVFVAHPLDNGLIGWHRLVARTARQCGIAGRAFVLSGGTPPELLAKAAGIVTVNSTVGVAALQQGVPVKVLGNAIYDVPGLTSQSSLAAFWHHPPPPEPALLDDFLRALVGTTQVKGGYYKRDSQDCAIAGFVERLEQGLYKLPALAAAEQMARLPREPARTIVIAGLSGAVAAALARAYAEPGVRLCLVDVERTMPGGVADDCRQRGAAVEIFTLPAGDAAAAEDALAALERGPPVEALVVMPSVEFAAPPKPVAAILASMRQRRRGEVLLVDPRVGLMPGTALDAIGSLTIDGAAGGQVAAAVRRQLRGSGVTVTLAAIRQSAVSAAARLRAPHLTEEEPDRVAARLIRAARRGRGSVAVPGAGRFATRLLPALVARLGEAMRHSLTPRAAPIREASEGTPVPGQSGVGD
ncbi:MAG: capsule biosynthesis protein [Thiohalocapsa sp.]